MIYTTFILIVALKNYTVIFFENIFSFLNHLHNFFIKNFKPSDKPKTRKRCKMSVTYGIICGKKALSLKNIYAKWICIQYFFRFRSCSPRPQPANEQLNSTFKAKRLSDDCFWKRFGIVLCLWRSNSFYQTMKQKACFKKIFFKPLSTFSWN